MGSCCTYLANPLTDPGSAGDNIALTRAIKSGSVEFVQRLRTYDCVMEPHKHTGTLSDDELDIECQIEWP